MERETNPAHTLQRIASELGVPVSSFYALDVSASRDDEALQSAIVLLLNAFAQAANSEERLRCVTLLRAEARRLRNLAESDDG